jgi:ATP-binding protein involved in chromosome partitioning
MAASSGSASGVPMLSMGQLVETGRALAWRGPMAAGALGQLVEADWGAADTLVLDLPPGTGDVQLTMIQKHKPAGAVIVSTPQDLALIDAQRAIDLFAKAGVPIIGLVENMAGYACPHCGEVSDPFGRGGAEAAAAAMGIPFLGRIPLDIAIRTASDAGEPPAAGGDDRLFAPLGQAVAAWLGERHAG